MDNELTTTGYMKRTTPFKDNHSVQSKQLCLNQELLVNVIQAMEFQHMEFQGVAPELRYISYLTLHMVTIH